MPLPSEVRQRLAFVIDAAGRRIIAPWLRDTLPLPSDEARLAATVERLDLDALPAPVCWCWPDRPPEPVRAARLQTWARDRAVYRLPTRTDLWEVDLQ
jgi:hypothetical protein